MQVTAMDADLLFDDKLGTATTDRDAASASLTASNNFAICSSAPPTSTW
jgi:hypothetical protein